MFSELLKKHFFLFTLIFILVFVSCEKQKIEKKIIEEQPNNNTSFKIVDGFIIDGKIVSNKDTSVYLLNHKRDTINTSTTLNKRFVFEGKVKTPDTYFLLFENTTTPFIIENTDFNVILDSLQVNILGGNLNTKQQEFQNKNNLLAKRSLEYYNDYANNDINLNSYLNKIEKLHRNRKKSMNKYIIDNQHNILSKIVLTENKFTSKEIVQLRRKINKTNNPNFYKHLTTLKEQEELTEAKNKILRRPQAPLFSGVNLNGRKSSLKELMKGKKAFIIDFWASWCPPCRESSAEIIQIYNEYSHKGLGILTVSEDRSVNDWRIGVNNDGIDIWTNIYDDYNRISNMYGASALPHLVLIDGDGKIIKNKISMTDLKVELKKIFK